MSPLARSWTAFARVLAFSQSVPPSLESFFMLGVIAGADVLGHQVELGGGHIKNIGPGIGDFYIVFLHAVGGHFYHAHIPADAMVLMDHQIAGERSA